MATKRKVWLSAIASIALIAVVGLGLAFKPASNGKKADYKKRATVTWYYNSNSPSSSDITNGSLWTTTDPNHTGCGSANLALPCSLQVDDAVTTTAELDSYFTSQYSDDAAAIKADADSRRPIP